MLSLHSSIQVQQADGTGQWQLLSPAGSTRINATVAAVLLLAVTPISLTSLIDRAMASIPGPLLAMDVLVFIEGALAQQWLEYRP